MALTIEELLKKLKREKLEKEEREKLNENLINTQREKSRQDYLKTNRMLYETINTSTSVSSSSAGGKALNRRLNIPTVTTDSYVNYSNGTIDLTGTITSDGNSEIIEAGFCWALSSNPTIDDYKKTTVDLTPPIPIVSSPFTMNCDMMDLIYETVYGRTYATNAIGTGYGEIVSFQPEICIAKGTNILLSNGENKYIEDISYEDELMVWNFDDGIFDTSKPMWIKKSQSVEKYNLLKFSDGTILKTINQHRIYNIEKGKFTQVMMSDTPIGTHTFNFEGKEIQLISKEVILEEVEYYNVITHYHMNMFANGVLTSCRYNNLYPILNMKYLKEDRVFRDKSEYDLPDVYYHGLRLSEQTSSSQEITWYVNRLIKNEMILECV
jgi:hypothetical protein